MVLQATGQERQSIRGDTRTTWILTRNYVLNVQKNMKDRTWKGFKIGRKSKIKPRPRDAHNSCLKMEGDSCKDKDAFRKLITLLKNGATHKSRNRIAFNENRNKLLHRQIYCSNFISFYLYMKDDNIRINRPSF